MRDITRFMTLTDAILHLKYEHFNNEEISNFLKKD